jgi:hypothetical protein
MCSLNFLRHVLNAEGRLKGMPQVGVGQVYCYIILKNFDGVITRILAFALALFTAWSGKVYQFILSDQCILYAQFPG